MQNKDTAREILSKLDDRSLIITCNSSKYFRYEVCDEKFWERRYHKRFPGQKRIGSNTWRESYLLTVSGYGSTVNEGGVNFDITIDPEGAYYQSLVDFVQRSYGGININFRDSGIIRLLSMYLVYSMLRNPQNLFDTNTAREVMQMIAMYQRTPDAEPYEIYKRVFSMPRIQMQNFAGGL